MLLGSIWETVISLQWTRIINTKRQRLVQINLLIKKAKLTLLKSIYSHLKTSNKQMLVLFRTRPGKVLIRQKKFMELDAPTLRFTKRYSIFFTCSVY